MPGWDRLPATPVGVDIHQHRVELNRIPRAAFLAGVEERWRQRSGRGLTETELRRVMSEYPGATSTEIDTGRD